MQVIDEVDCLSTLLHVREYFPIICCIGRPKEFIALMTTRLGKEGIGTCF